MAWKSDQFYFSKIVRGELLGWKDATLWKASAQIKPHMMSVSSFMPLLFDIWDGPPCQEELQRHLDRILKADLDYPIILGASNELMDGYHRIAKAMLMNQQYIKAVHLYPMPAPDFRRAVKERA